MQDFSGLGSSHDLRCRFAQGFLVDEGANPRLVMSVGGWSSFQAIGPHLNEPSKGFVTRAFDEARLG